MTIHFDIDLGTNTLKGVLTLEAAELVVEWRRYNLMDVPVSPLESLSVPYSDIVDVMVRRKILRPVIEITAKKASVFGPMPLPAGNLSVLRVRVARSDRSKAEGWGAEAYLRVVDAVGASNFLIDK